MEQVKKETYYGILTTSGLLLLSKRKDGFIQTDKGIRVRDSKGILDFSMQDKYGGKSIVASDIMKEFRVLHKDKRIVLL